MRYTTRTGPYLTCRPLEAWSENPGGRDDPSAVDRSTVVELHNCAAWSVAGVSHREQPIWKEIWQVDLCCSLVCVLYDD